MNAIVIPVLFQFLVKFNPVWLLIFLCKFEYLCILGPNLNVLAVSIIYYLFSKCIVPFPWICKKKNQKHLRNIALTPQRQIFLQRVKLGVLRNQNISGMTDTYRRSTFEESWRVFKFKVFFKKTIPRNVS